MDKISVIIPVYKTEKYLEKCIKSITEQTYKNLEIILIDDDSPDDSPRICDEWALKDDRIAVYHIENKGVSNARNIALNLAQGEYIAFIDSDDYAESNMIELLYNSIKDNGSDISVCGFYGGSYNDDLLNELPLDTALKYLVTGEYVYGVLWNKLYKKQIICDLEMPPLVCCEDMVFNYFAFKKAKSISMVSEKLYHYNSRDDSASAKKFGVWAFDSVISKEIILDNECDADIRKYAVKGLINSCFVVLSGIIQSNNCYEYFDKIRQIVINHFKDVFFSGLFSKREKLKTIVLKCSKKMYVKLVIKGK